MKTVTYNDILYRAAERAGRTRDNLPTSEARLLQAALAVDLEDVWNGQAWPELVQPIENVTVTARLFDKREGDSNEMGDILGVWTADPSVTSKTRAVEFEELDDAVRIGEGLASVWVEWMLPAPDLDTLTGEPLAAYTIPRRFRNYLSLRGAGMLLNSDVAGSGDGLLALAERALAVQIQRLPPSPPWRRNVRVRVASLPQSTIAVQ